MKNMKRQTVVTFFIVLMLAQLVNAQDSTTVTQEVSQANESGQATVVSLQRHVH